MQLSIRTDRTPLRTTARSTRYLHISLTAPVAPAPPPGASTARSPVNVGIVLDRSGSMPGDAKFPLATRAVAHALRTRCACSTYTIVFRVSCSTMSST